MKPNVSFLESMREAIVSLNAGGVKQVTETIQRALRHASGPSASATLSTDEADTFVPTVVRPPAKGATADARDAGGTIEECGHTSTFIYANAAGERRYRLYVPAGNPIEPLSLIVMLHGCTQDADGFAAGTRMNQFADRHRCLVAYPVQPQNANPSKCWNWFNPADQHRGSGEPSILAGITQQIIAQYPVDPARVYVAGLSAGGAMAAIMVTEYPELFAAAGVHSGLPPHCAHDLPSALAAMKGGGNRGHATRNQHGKERLPQRPLIVFHGDADLTVSPKNAALLLDGFVARDGIGPEMSRAAKGKRTATVERLISTTGQHAELWTIHGAPHAWSGGDARGSYTDPTGPDASAEMLRFFLEHPSA